MSEQAHEAQHPILSILGTVFLIAVPASLIIMLGAVGVAFMQKTQSNRTVQVRDAHPGEQASLKTGFDRQSMPSIRSQACQELTAKVSKCTVQGDPMISIEMGVLVSAMVLLCMYCSGLSWWNWLSSENLSMLFMARTLRLSFLIAIYSALLHVLRLAVGEQVELSLASNESNDSLKAKKAHAVFAMLVSIPLYCLLPLFISMYRSDFCIRLLLGMLQVVTWCMPNLRMTTMGATRIAVVQEPQMWLGEAYALAECIPLRRTTPSFRSKEDDQEEAVATSARCLLSGVEESEILSQSENSVFSEGISGLSSPSRGHRRRQSSSGFSLNSEWSDESSMDDKHDAFPGVRDSVLDDLRKSPVDTDNRAKHGAKYHASIGYVNKTFTDDGSKINFKETANS